MIRSRPCHLVVLAPPLETLAERERGRSDKGYLGGWSVEAHDAAFLAETPRRGLWLHTADQTPEQTVDEILTRTSGD